MLNINLIRHFTYIALLFLFSCGGTVKHELPSNILNKKELIALIVDLQILESHFQRQFSRVDLYRDALDASSQSIFEAHEISKEKFTNSMDYYADDSDTLFSIYEAALDTINFRLNTVN